MSKRVIQILCLVAALGVVFAAFAGGASAKSHKLSHAKKVQIRKALKKQIKHNPKAIQKASFIRKAALVNFKLPITIQLRDGDKWATPTNETETANPNKATIDLGPSLGQREINLGGRLKAVIGFHDSFDGGALGNVDLEILPDPNYNLTSTSVPLLWNPDVTDQAGGLAASGGFDGPALQSLGYPSSLAPSSCEDFVGQGNATDIPFGQGLLNAGSGLPGYPYWTSGAAFVANSVTPNGFLPVNAGVDDPNNLLANKKPGDDMVIGGNPNPFPVGSNPASASTNVKDTVLRTNALKLGIAPVGVAVTGAEGGAGPQQLTGRSGGEANLFGKIPGKNVGIDVTVSLSTRINSILRIMDQDVSGGPLIGGSPWPAGVFNCRQVWSGGVDNVLGGIRLAGNLKIAPAITKTGALRIAKATISTPNIGQLSQDDTRIALAACLVPYKSFQTPQNNSDTAATIIPTTVGSPPFAADSDLPVDTSTAVPAPAANCNSAPTNLVAASAFSGSVSNLGGSATSDGYAVTGNGSKASVAGDLVVNNVDVDVLLG